MRPKHLAILNKCGITVGTTGLRATGLIGVLGLLMLLLLLATTGTSLYHLLVG